VPLIPDGLENLPATNNVDFRFGKWFKMGRFDVQGLAEVYNLLNISTPLAVRSISYGIAYIPQPVAAETSARVAPFQYARFLKFGVQARW
jgi:hypothetical protein